MKKKAILSSDNQGNRVIFLNRCPRKFNGAVAPNSDGSYTIFLNADCSIEQQRQTYEHELRHIQRGDFSSDKHADELEVANNGQRGTK